MKSMIAKIIVFCLPLTLSGCYGTIIGIVAGPVMGGPSLVGKLYDSDAKIPTKIIGTPFTLVTGAGLGIFPGLWNGLEYDLYWMTLVDKGPETNDLFDPWHRALNENKRLFKIEEDLKDHSLWQPTHHDRDTIDNK